MKCQNPKCSSPAEMRTYRSEVLKNYLICDSCGTRIEVSTTTGEILPVVGAFAAVTGAVLALFAWMDNHLNT